MGNTDPISFLRAIFCVCLSINTVSTAPTSRILGENRVHTRFPSPPPALSPFPSWTGNASPRIISRNCAHRRVHYGGRAGSTRKISRPCFSSVSWLNISNFHASPCSRSNCRVHGSCNVVEPELVTRHIRRRDFVERRLAGKS